MPALLVGADNNFGHAAPHSSSQELHETRKMQQDVAKQRNSVFCRWSVGPGIKACVSRALSKHALLEESGGLARSNRVCFKVPPILTIHGRRKIKINLSIQL